MILIPGALVGFLSGAYLTDAVGRKASFFMSVIGSVLLTLVYLFAPLSNSVILPMALCWTTST
jgi:uncharacterized membrane protein YeaQ/YmgE (transglycosylase-associated protein family)